MHGLVGAEDARKQKRKECFMWHKRLNRDLELTRAAVRLANMFLHDFEFACTCTASCSHHDAQLELGLSAPTVWRAFQQLQERRWLISTNVNDCYRPGPGPFHA